MKTLLASVVAAALALACAPAALGAGTVERSSATAQIRYEASGTADVTVTDALVGSTVEVTLAETGIQLGMTATDCDDNGNSVTCVYSATDATPTVSASLMGGDDTFDAGTTIYTRISAQDSTTSDDILIGGQLSVTHTGSPTGDFLRGGFGADVIRGGAGNDDIGELGGGVGDLVEGGPGDDRVVARGGDGLGDIYRGGPGLDTLLAFDGSDTIDYTVDLAAGMISDPSATGSEPAEEFENAEGDDGDDLLLGSDGPNLLMGGSGNDRLDGRLGSDTLIALAGADTLSAQDGVADRVNAGAGADTCLVDQLDQSDECEDTQLVTLTPLGAILPDVVSPGCKLPGLARKPRARRVARRGLTVTAACDEPGRVTVRLLTRVRRGGGARLARAGDVELATRSMRLGAGDRAKLRLKVGRRLRRLLRRGARLRVELSATDSAGNRAKPLVRKLRLR